VDEVLFKTTKHFLNTVKDISMKRCFDLVLALIASFILILPITVIALALIVTSKGTIIYWSDRVGQNNKIFRMPKFRTMKLKTPAIATHLLSDTKQFMTPVGGFLRKTSLDELPQLWSILMGHMSFVGPRPALFNQDDLIQLRTTKGIHKLVPGLTGWAQVNGRDELPIPIKVDLDLEYVERQSFYFDIYVLWLTFIKVVRGEGVSH
jgi:O-antigen biosynthesis protein WbqP